MTQPAMRRTVLATGAAALAAGCVGCGGDKDKASEPASPASATSKPASPPAATSASAASGGKEVARTSDIPEGGGKVLADRKIVITQPKKGEYKAFSAVCTHQGCLVRQVADGTIDCPCHGSKYHIADGSVADGPATRPLAEKKIEVEGNSIRLT
ncbi:Rieske (2Fe-2S) protein [Streptomyces sp. NPDC048514]|uniref:Rieske (2Fe-2S) protein n=1 Tax=Streptomyces sp. NPDC048514 TaxID=3365564 RepID=UPI00371B8C21